MLDFNNNFRNTTVLTKPTQAWGKSSLPRAVRDLAKNLQKAIRARALVDGLNNALRID